MSNIPTPAQMLQMVKEIADLIRTRAHEAFTAEEKVDHSLVTALDQEANDLVAKWCRQFSDVRFIGEEGADPEVPSSINHVIYLDPLDGTSTFLAGKTEVAVAMTLMQRIDRAAWLPEACIIAEPMVGRVWTAAHGEGVFLHREGTAPNKLPFLPAAEPARYNVSAITWTGVPYHLDAVQQALITGEEFIEHGSGCAAINGPLIAWGRMHGFLFGGSSAVEAAAITLMVQRVGGVVTDLFGRPLSAFKLIYTGEAPRPDFLLPRGIIAARSPTLAKKLANIVRSCN